jgi:hypothetical protein
LLSGCVAESAVSAVVDKFAIAAARSVALAAGAFAVGMPALADPGYYVVTAYDNAGLRSIDTRYWTVKFPNAPVTTWPEFGLGYGVTSRWYSEVFASYIGSAESATRLNTLNWQNEVLLTQGELPLDIAMHASLVRKLGYDAGYSIEYGPVLQTDIGHTQLNANIFFEREFGGEDSTPTQMKYQWQIRYRWRPQLNIGLQGFGELGTWNDWSARDRQSHRAGPALFGKLPLGDERTLLLQAAWLTGSIYGHHGSMFSARAQLTF